MWGDISLKTDNRGQEFIEYNERQTKTRTGDDVRNIRDKCPRAWSNPDNPNRCPVAAYKLYKEKRPAKISGSTDPYYIAPITHDKNPAITDRWFISQPVGVNKLSSLMATMAKNAGLDRHKKITNHSARKYLVQTLRDQNVEPASIMQITGHKNVQSITNYSELSEESQHHISDLLSHRNTAPRPALAAPPSSSLRPALPYTPMSALTAPPYTPSSTSYMPHPFPGVLGPPFTLQPTYNNTEAIVSSQSADNRMFQNCYIASLTINNNYKQAESRPRKRRAARLESDSDESQSQ